MTVRASSWVPVVCLSACIFDPANTHGLPCNNDDECGGALPCVERVCGGEIQSVSDESSSGTSSTEHSEESGQTGLDGHQVPDGCTPQDTQCVRPGVIEYCHEGKLHTYGCPAFCGQFRESYGCFNLPSANTDSCLCGVDREPCTTTGHRVCSGNNGIAICDGKKREYFDCDEVCGDAGYGGAVGCSDPGNGQAVCECSFQCTDGAARCRNDFAFEVCHGNAWHHFSCTQACADSGLPTDVSLCVYSPQVGDTTCLCY